MKDFLEENEFIDFSTNLIRIKAQELFKDSMKPVDKAQTAYLFVRNEIPHSFDCNASVITVSASDVLKYKTGICHTKANLLAALLRSQGIPTGFRYQHITLMEDNTEGYCLHCFNAIFINNKWIEVDTRGINAQFSLNLPILAFENRPQYDEYFFDGIFAKADMPTMNMLKNARTLQDVIDGLSEKPFDKPNIYFK